MLISCSVDRDLRFKLLKNRAQIGLVYDIYHLTHGFVAVSYLADFIEIKLAVIDHD